MKRTEATDLNGQNSVEYERRLVDYDEALRNGAKSDETETEGLPISKVFQSAKECIDLMHRVWHVTDTGDDGSDETAYPEDNKGDARIDREHDVPRKIGRFEIIRELGRGGLGVVFLANDPRLGRHVALKVPRPEALLNHDARRRFLIEGEIAAGLRHPGIVSVYEVGEDGPVCFIAAEFSDGMTLGEWMSAPRSPVPTDQAARIVADLAGAVAHAHGRGVIHRDIKPGNVMLEDGVLNDNSSGRVTVKLTDFGTAKLLENDEHVTRTGALIGTAAYMAPEQATGHIHDIDVRTDIHALGAVLYELLTGSGPFAAENEAASLRRVVEDEPTRPRKMRPDVPRDLEAICLKCLNKHQDNRYATANDLGQDLERFLRREPTVARPVTVVEWVSKWALRRPALATLGTSLVVSLVMFVVVAGILNVRLQTAFETSQQTTDQLGRRVYTTDMQAAFEAFDSADLGSTRMLLASQIPATDADRDVRDWSWKMLDRLVHQSIVEWPTDAAVFSVVVSPDGRWVASGDEKSNLVVRELATGAIVTSFDTGQIEINTVAFGPDGSEIATAGKDGSVRRWRTADWVAIGEPLPHAAEVYTVAYAPDGSWLASGGRDQVLRLWRKNETTPFYSIIHSDDIEALAISPIGDRVVTGSKYGYVNCYDVASGELVWTILRDHPRRGLIACVSISPDGRVVAVCRKDLPYVEYLSSDTGIQFSDGPELSDWPVVCRFTPDGSRMVIGCKDGRVHIRPAPERDTLHDAAGMTVAQTSSFGLIQTKGLRSLGVSPDGTRILTSGDGTAICVTEVASFERHQRFERLPTTWASHVRLDPTGHCFAMWHEDTRAVSVRDAADGRLVTKAEFPPQLERVFTLSADGMLLALSDGADVHVTTAVENATVCRLEGHHGRVTHVGFSLDVSLIATAAEDNTVRLWDAESGAQLAIVVADDIVAISCSSVDRLLAVADNKGAVRLWEQGRAEPFRVYENLLSAQDLAFSPHRREFAMADIEGHIRMFHVDADNETWGFGQSGLESATSVVFSPDGEFLLDVKHDHHHIVVLDCTDGARTGEISGFGKHQTVNACRFAPDGTNIVVACHDGSVHLRPVPALRLFHTNAPAVSIDVSNNGELLVASERPGYLILYDLTAGNVVRRIVLGDHSHWLPVEFMPNDLLVGVGGQAYHQFDVATGAPSKGSGAHNGALKRGLAYSEELGLRAMVAEKGGFVFFKLAPDSPELLWNGVCDISIAHPDDDTIDAHVGKDDSTLTSCDFSPDAKWIATSSENGTVIIWPIIEGLGSVPTGVGDDYWAVHLRDGDLYLAHVGPEVEPPYPILLDEKPIILNFHDNPVLGVKFSPDGRYLASLSDAGDNGSKTVLYDFVERRVTHTQTGHGWRCLEFSADSQWLIAAGADERIHVWNVENGQQVADEINVETAINDIAWIGDRRIAWTGENGNVGVAIVPRLVCTSASGERGELTSMAVTPNDDVVFLDEDGQLSCRELATLMPGARRVISQDLVSTQMTALALSADGVRVAVAYDSKVQIVSTADGRTAGWLNQHDMSVDDVAFSLDGSLVATASADSNVRLWELPSCRLLKTFEGHSRAATAVTFSPDASLCASGSGDKIVFIWDVRTGNRLAQLDGHTTAIRDVCFSPAGDVLVSSSDSSARLWDVASGELLHPPLHCGYSHRLAFSADGRTLVVASEQGPVELCHVETGKIVGTMMLDPKRLSRGFDVAYTDDGQLRAIVKYEGNGVNLVTLSPD